MAFVGQLWLPILLSAVFVFIASSIIHMVLKWHDADVAASPNQEAVQNAVRDAAPGWYAFPMAPDPKERMSAEWMKKWADGPAGMMTIYARGPMNMGKLLAQWFVLNLVVSFFTAYVAAHALDTGVSYLTVFRVVGTVGFMTYGFGVTGDTIWFGRPWRAWRLTMLDSLIYGCVMAGTFGWLWPR